MLRVLVVLALAHVALAVWADRGLAAPWCGTLSTEDRPQAVAGYPIRVIYAIPAEGEDHSTAVAPQIAAVIDEIDAWWRREDPARTPRFDLYRDSCGPQLDLRLWRVPTIHTGTTDADTLFDLLWDELARSFDSGRTKQLIFFDGATDEGPDGQICGIGAPAAGSSGLGLATVFSGIATVFLGSCTDASLATVAAHELLHALGSSNALASAPHTCPDDRGHVCDSTGDILYPYAQSGIPLSSFVLDAGKDDYYGNATGPNMQVVPWLRLVNEQTRLSLAISGPGRVYSDIPGVDCTTSCATDWDRGSTVRLSATAGQGRRFVRWGGACTGTTARPDQCAITLDAAKDVTALFAPAAFPVQVAVVGRGLVTSAPTGLRCSRARCSRSFTSYEPVRLTAKPGKGWRWKSWAGACRGSRPVCTLPMSRRADVRAVFVPVAG